MKLKSLEKDIVRASRSLFALKDDQSAMLTAFEALGALVRSYEEVLSLGDVIQTGNADRRVSSLEEALGYDPESLKDTKEVIGLADGSFMEVGEATSEDADRLFYGGIGMLTDDSAASVPKRGPSKLYLGVEPDAPRTALVIPNSLVEVTGTKDDQNREYVLKPAMSEKELDDIFANESEEDGEVIDPEQELRGNM
jgi:hypothetical protein